MKKNPVKKLHLNRETLMALDPDHLKEAVGGITDICLTNGSICCTKKD